MRKLKLFLTLLMLMCIGVTQMWGAVESGTTYSLNSGSFPTDWSGTNTFNGGTGYFLLTESANYVQTDEFCQNGFTSITIKARKFGGPSGSQHVFSVQWVVSGEDPVTLTTITPSNTTLTNYTINSGDLAEVTGNKTGYIKICANSTAASGKGAGISEVTVTYTAGTCTAPVVEPFTVTLMDNSATLTEESAGAGVTLPSRDGCEGYTFAGWTKTWTAVQSSWTPTAPEIIPAGAYTPAADENLYPVYTKTESGSGTAFVRYEKVTSDPEDWSGTYLLAANTAGTTYYTFTGQDGSNNYGSSSEHTPGTTEKTAWEVVVAKTTNGYSLYHTSSSKYLGLTASSNSLYFNASFTASTYEWTLSADNGVKSVAYDTRYIECNTSSSFRVACYTATQKRFYLYKRIEGSASTTYYISEPDCTTPQCEKLGTPDVSVPAEYLKYNSAKLTWEAVENADKYVVKFNGVDQDATSNTYFEATGLTAETQYSYQVKALAEEGQDDYCDGVFSASVNLTTKAAPALAVDPALKDFGTVATDAAVSQVFSVSGTDLEAGNLTITVPSGYSVSPASINVAAAGSLEATNVTVSKDASTTGSYNGNMTISGCGLAADVTVALSMTVAEAYTVQFSTGAGNPSQVDITEEAPGAGITLPAGPTPKCSADGWIFAGWAKVAVNEETTTAPTLLSGTYNPETNNETLYAVYKKTEGGGGSETKYVQVTGLAQVNAGGEFIITNGSKYLPSTTTSSSVAQADMVAIADGVVTGTVVDAMKWTISAADGDGYVTVKNAESKYLYATNSNSGLRVGATEDSWKFEEYTVSEVLGFAMQEKSNSRWCAVYTDGSDWRPYGSKDHTNYKTNSGRLDLYKATEVSSSTTYYLSAPDCCEKHAITIANGIENGSVETDLEEACQNTVVTLTPTADGSYHFESWSVKDANDNTITVTDNKFSMPATAVTVSATFAHDACSNLAKPELDGEIAKTYNSATIAWVELDGAVEYAVSVVRHSDSESIFSGNVDASSKVLEGLTPETQYDYTIMAVGDGTTKCADGNGVLEGNFTTSALPQVKLTLMVGGAEDERSANHPILTAFNLPSTASVTDCPKEFVGWDRISTCAVAPEFAPGAEMTFAANAEDLTLYAVFADVVTPGVTSYVKTDLANIASGSVVIITESKTVAEETTIWAMSNDKGTSAGPAAVEVTDENNKIASPAENILWNIVKGEESFMLYPNGETEKWLYCTTSNDGVRVGTGDNKNFKIDNSYLYNIQSTGRYLGVYNDKLDFRCYTSINSNITGQTLAFYKKNTSAAVYGNYSTTCAATVADPVIAPEAGTYNEAQEITITCETEGATIYYTTDGNDPTNSSAVYDAENKPTVSESATVKAIAIKGALASEVVSAAYIFQVATPTISGETSFLDKATVTLACTTDGATIKYSIDGTNPSVTYSEPFDLEETATVKAIAVKDNWTTSAVAEQAFTKIVPMTVAEARTAIDEASGETISNQYVTGIISQVDSYNSNYHSITYWISDDGTSTNALKVYSGLGINGANFNSKDDVAVGAGVVVKGDLLLYNEDYEINYNNYLISYVAKELSGIAVKTAPTKVEYKEGDNFDPTGLVVTASYTVGQPQDIAYAGNESDFSFEPALTTALTASEEAVVVTITYGGKTATQNITVSAKQNYIVTITEPVNGTVVVKNGENEIESGVTEIIEGTTLTIEATPATDYAIDKIYVNSEAIEGTTFVLSTTTTVNVTFKSQKAYTVSFSTGEGNSAVANVTEASYAAGITLPAGPETIACADWSFAGWATAAVASETIEAPALMNIGDTYHPTDDVTLYAVYQKGGNATSDSKTFTFGTIASANNWQNGVAYNATIAPVTVAHSDNGNNGKYYTSDQSWRMYDGGTVTITAEGGSVTSVTSTPSQTFTISEGVATLACTATIKFTEIVVGYTVPSAKSYWSVPTCAEPTCENLAAPTLDGDIVVDHQSAIIAWNGVEDAVSYVLNITEHEGDAVLTDESITDLSDLSYLVENLKAETQYDYSIMAVGDGVNKCAEGNALLEGDFTTDAAPSTESATLTLSEVGGADYAIDADEHHVGDNVNLPTELKYAGCTGKVLVGWSSVEISEPGDMPTENYWAAGAEFPLTATSQTLYAVYATAGEGAASTLFSETFNDCEGTGGNDGSWSGSSASSTLTADNAGWTFDNGSGAKQCAKFGTASKKGSAETPAISITGSATLTFKAGAWNGGTEGTTLNITATGATLDKSSVEMTKGAWSTYTVAITNVTDPVQIKFEAKNTSNNRFFLDEVVVSQSTISYSAYTTSCTEALAVPTFNITGGEFATAQTITLSAVEDATIYYTTDGSNPTSESDVYSVPIVLDVCGTTTIKAFAKKNAQESEIVSETYIINLPITNTAENAYTPAEAIAIVDGACDKSEAVFVKGVVTSASLNSTLTNNNAQYNGSYNVYVKEAETDGSVTFEFFRMWKDGEGTAFEEGDIAEGDTLIATGTLTKFTNNNTQVTTYEFNAGCYMVERKPFIAEKEHIANTQETAYTVAQAIVYCNDAITYDLNDEVYVKGVAIAAPNNAGTFNIHDANVENTFRIYKSVLSEELTAAGVEIAANDTVIAKGKILLYNNTTPEMDEGCVVVEVKKYVAHTIAVNPTAVAFGEVEQNATTVDAIEFNAYLTNVASATVTLGGTNASAFSISKNALTENDVISVSVASTALELGEYAATITLHDAAEVAEDVVVNVTMTIIAQDDRKKAQDLDGFEAISGNLNTDIQYASYKGGGTADPNVKDAAIQLYQKGGTEATGGYITFTALKGCKIDQVKITTAKNATNIAYAADGGDLSATTENVAAGTAYLTSDGLDAQEVSIYCMHNNSNNRLFVATAIVYYTGEAQAINHYTVDASAVETTEFKKNATFSWDGLKVYACYATDESDNVDITADCHVEADLSTEGAKKAKVYFGELEVGEYDITVIAGQENPALAYTPAELTIPAAEVGTWNAPEFSNTFNVSPISYSSNNTAVATVTEDGVIALAGGYGTAKITASFEETEDYIASVATYTITITEPVNKIDGEWHKVTSTSDIMAGSKVIVVGDKNGTKYAMGAQNTNNRAAVVAEEDANGVITANEGTKTFTLVDAGNGLYAFKANNGKYLYAASGSSNYLKEQATIDGNASWLITIASNGEATIEAQGTYSNNLMRMNKNGNSNPLFSCYGSGQTAVMLYVNRKEYVAPAVDPENPTPATEVTINTNVDEEEIVASGNVIVTVDAKEFEEPKSYIAQNGATIIINNSGTSTETEAKSVVVEDGSRIEAAAPTTTPTIYFATTMGSTQTPGTASELGSVTNITLAQGGEIIYDLTLGVDMSTPEGAAKAANQWHAFTLPFPVDAINGIYNAANGEKLTNEVDYAIMDYHGDVRANGLYGWKKYRGVLQPGVFYIMTVNGDVQTFRFKKAATGAMTQTTSMGYTAYNGSGTTTDYGWNGIGNPSWVSGTVTVNVQVLDPYTYTYQTLTAGVNITVSTPFFYNAGGDGSTGSVVMQDAGAGANYAPRRTPANEIKNVAISFGNEVFRDKLYISASEDALNEYEQDKDLVRMIMSNTPKVAQIFGNAYGMKLSMVNAPMANGKAEYSLTLYAPNAGEYTISAPEMENVDIYLTYNDAIIWNLSMGEYTNDFAKGNNEGYGLILKAKAPNAATGVDELEVSETAQKVIIDEHVFILRGEKMYDAAGRMVK